jgi:hypothetical protein
MHNEGVELGLFYGGTPYPPAPGVSIRSLSPTFHPVLHRPPMLTKVPFSRTRRFRPQLPGSPPSKPYGCRTRRSLNMLTVSGRRGSNSRTTPSPPLCFPLPPLPFRIENSRSTTGYRLSRISGSVQFHEKAEIRSSNKQTKATRFCEFRNCYTKKKVHKKDTKSLETYR